MEVVDELTRPRPEDQLELQQIQVFLRSEAHPAHVRSLKVSKMEFYFGLFLETTILLNIEVDWLEPFFCFFLYLFICLGFINNACSSV